jgi:SNF family Na+-dependent transporter
MLTPRRAGTAVLVEGKGKLMNWRLSLIVAAAGLVLLTAFKFTYLLADNQFDITRAPVVFIVPLVALIVGIALTASGRASGIVVVSLVALPLLLLMVSALVRHGMTQQNVADAMLVFLGIPLAILALISAMVIWRQRGAVT